MNNYALINDKHVELTDEQVKTLGVETRKNPFERVNKNEIYYFIKGAGDLLGGHVEINDSDDNKLHDNINYFNNKQFAEQVAMHQLLYRKLLKFAYDNECEDTAEWNGTNRHWFIGYDHYNNVFNVIWHGTFQSSGVYFSTMESAERAIKEVIMPFLKEHLNFVW